MSLFLFLFCFLFIFFSKHLWVNFVSRLFGGTPSNLRHNGILDIMTFAFEQWKNSGCLGGSRELYYPVMWGFLKNKTRILVKQKNSIVQVRFVFFRGSFSFLHLNFPSVSFQRTCWQIFATHSSYRQKQNLWPFLGHPYWISTDIKHVYCININCTAYYIQKVINDYIFVSTAN